MVMVAGGGAMTDDDRATVNLGEWNGGKRSVRKNWREKRYDTRRKIRRELQLERYGGKKYEEKDRYGGKWILGRYIIHNIMEGDVGGQSISAWGLLLSITI